MFSLRILLVLLFIICLDIMETHTKRILGVFPLNIKSHTNVFNALMKGLAKKGHQVDVITHYPLKNPPKNYRTVVNLDGTRADYVNKVSLERPLGVVIDPVSYYAFGAGNEICTLLSLKEMQNVIKNTSGELPYDLVITQVHSHTLKYRYFMYTEKAQTDSMRKYFSPDIPGIREIERTVALTFVNSYHHPFGIKPSTPGLIEIGGIHIEEDDSKLPPDLEHWMNESTNGVICFTLGSMILIETLPEETLLAFYGSFSKISPIRVLMKIADQTKLLPGLPENVRTSSWIAQIPILKHHNPRLFITHGGMLGIQEALYYKVPMIGIPLISDQFRNVETLVNKNIGIRLDYNKITLQSLDEALNAILNDPKYREAAERESQLFRDRPMSPMDTAIFWVEYISRNGGNSLRSPAANLYWWEVALLDVYGFIIFGFITLIYLVIFTAKFVIRRCFKTLSVLFKIKCRNCM